MHKSRLTAVLILMLVFVTGCWNRLELTDWAFVQAAAVDQLEDGTIRLTTQIYKPGGSVGPGITASKGTTFIDLVSTNQTIAGASHDVTNELGRNLQWSHMRVLLINEKLARSREINGILDFFTRSEEPRGSVSVMMTKGNASSFLSLNPLIESTMGQQLKSIVELAQVQSGKTVDVTLNQLSIFSKESSATVAIPLVRHIKEAQEVASVAGFAFLHFPEGKVVGEMSPSHSPYMVMLMNKFKGGNINLSCKNQVVKGEKSYDSFRVSHLTTKLRPTVTGNTVNISIQIEVAGNFNTINCAPVVTTKQIRAAKKQLEQTISKHVTETMSLLLKKQADVIGVGTHIHRHHKKEWKTLKHDWKKTFAKSDFDVKVKVEISNTGMNVGKPFSDTK